MQPQYKQFLHHIILYECHPNEKQTSRDFDAWVGKAGAQCYSKNMPNDWFSCVNPIIGWAVGSEGKLNLYVAYIISNYIFNETEVMILLIWIIMVPFLKI